MIDTHCHLDFYKDEELDEIINSSEFFNISKIINPGTTIDRCDRAIEISNKYSKIYYALGIHPEEVLNIQNIDIISEFEKRIYSDKFVAIGEIGLDYYYIANAPDFESIKNKQKELFIKQLDFAQKINKPVIVHTRNAGQDVLGILEKYDLKFVIHCFSEDLKFAKRVVEMGGLISFTGLITFKNADSKILEVVSEIPLEKIMVETDGPFLTPQQFRGKQNKPEYVGFVAEKIANIKNISLEQVEKIVDNNANNFFNLK